MGTEKGYGIEANLTSSLLLSILPILSMSKADGTQMISATPHQPINPYQPINPLSILACSARVLQLQTVRFFVDLMDELNLNVCILDAGSFTEDPGVSSVEKTDLFT